MTQVSERLLAARTALIFLFLVSFSSAVHAQAPAKVYRQWGVSGSLTPLWEVPSGAAVLFGGSPSIRGSEFQIGIVRAVPNGGDWGVSFVRKKITDATVDDSRKYCLPDQSCFLYGTQYIIRAAWINGVEFHKYIPLATIKRRLQFGLNFGGGIGAVEGDPESHVYSTSGIYGMTISSSGTTTVNTLKQQEATSKVTAKDALLRRSLHYAPMGRAEIVVASPLAYGLSMKVSGGINFPGIQPFGVTVSYLFGPH